MRPSLKWRGWKQWLLIGVAACVSMHFAGRRAAADLTVLFTASTDYTGAVPNASGTSYGYSYPNDPINQNPNIPAISPGVTLSPGSGGFDGNFVGPLPDGSTYGPFGYNGNAGGSTGWVTMSYTLPTSGSFQLVWEVANVINCAGSDALATDNIRINGNLIFPFQPPPGTLPAGFTGVGNYGTSGAVADLAPSGGENAFAWMDVAPNSMNVSPIFDTVDGYSASRLYSAVFTANAGDTITLDAAFLTNDGSPYPDYGIVALQSVPEPSSLIVAALGAIGMAGYALRRHLARAGCS
ncbi:MAG: PEP-CTERM sorting domain-containing protein [Isosphaeraceae bacterium]